MTFAIVNFDMFILDHIDQELHALKSLQLKLA